MPAGSEVAASASTSDVIVNLNSFGRVDVSWSQVANATAYQIVRTSAQGQASWTTTGLAWTDDGTSPGIVAPAPEISRWQVKNLFELKNARRVRIEGNVFENNWAHAQDGAAILFTPRNQDGGCSWCIVENVTFERNVVRRVGTGFVILGRDDYFPSRQLSGIVIRNNVVSDMGQEWGGSGIFAILLGEPRDVVIDHNTIISKQGQAVVQVDGPPITGFVFTNNVAQHNEYGIVGTSRAPGIDTITTYFPGESSRGMPLAACRKPLCIRQATNSRPSRSSRRTSWTTKAGTTRCDRLRLGQGRNGWSGSWRHHRPYPVVTAPRNLRIIR